MQTETLIFQLRSTSRELVRQFGFLENRFAEIGSTSQCHALVELEAQGVMNVGELSAVLNLDKSTTSRLINQLCEKHFCQMQPDENDRRNKLISLTKKGLEQVAVIHREANSQVKQALGMMSDEEQALALKGLSIYAKALRRSHLQNEYEIRKLHKEDMPHLIQLIKIIWAEFGFDSTHSSASIFEEELHRTYETYNAKRSKYYVLVQGKKIVGGAGFTPLAGEEKTVCELKGMYLSSTLRGCGLGTVLLKKVLQEAAAEGFTQCYLETMNFMHGANTLYQKFGFQPLSKPMGETGHHWTNSWYIKNIAQRSK